MERDWWTAEEAAERVGIPVRTARRLMSQGRFPGAFKFGGRWRVSRPALLRALHGDAFEPEESNE